MREGESKSIANDEGKAGVPHKEETQELGVDKAPSDSVAVEKVLSKAEEMQREADQWREKSEEYLDKYRRVAAEFSNYRKRQERERIERELRTSAKVIRPLLPVVDDFERAIDKMPKESPDAGWVEGILLIERKLKTILKGFQVVPIEALGKPFDPRFHSALLQCESNEYPAGTVVEELQTGYMIADRVLRPTTVKVSAGSEKESMVGPGTEVPAAE